MYPDIVLALKNCVNFEKVNNCIIDCELVAFDLEKNQVKNFNEIQHRRKGNVLINDVTIPVCVFVFDLLYLNNEILINYELNQRRKIFFENFQIVNQKFQFVEYKDLEDTEEIESFLLESVDKGCEGLMIKSLLNKSIYEPGQRCFS